MAKQKARLKDIAERTGYGTNTVSLALRGSTRISAAAREKIARAAEELDYVPNYIAKSLVSRRSNTVGLILHEITNPILTSAAEKIQRTLAARGYGVLFASSNGSLEEEMKAIEMFRARMIDGLLIYPVRHGELAHLRRLRDRNFPVVLLVDVEDSGIDAVGIDEYAGAYDATRHMIDEGHRRIGALVTPQYQTNRKYFGYLDALASAGLEADAALVEASADHSISGGIEAMGHLMARPHRPTAIFASSDVIALGALRWAKLDGVEVPGQLAIIGFDNDEAARYAVTPVSTIDNNVDDLAQRSVARLLELVDAGHVLPSPRADLLRGRLIVRESTRATARETAGPGRPARLAAALAAEAMPESTRKKHQREREMSNGSPEQHDSRPKGMLPNSRFPLLVHRRAVPGGGVDAVLARFRGNGWLNNWRYPGIYTYPHFHSTTHECLGVAIGWMEIELFGSGGARVRVEAGDVIVVPAGVSHSMTGNSDDILMVGGYPDGRDWDNIQEGHITEEVRRAAAKRIMMLPIPSRDPVTGETMREWIEAPSSVDAGLNDFRDGLNPV